MPKDYQEVERIVEEFRTRFDSLLGKPVCCQMKNNDCGCDGHTYADEAVAFIEDTLTTYGNARELQGVEKVEKGMPAIQELPSSLQDPAGFMRVTGFNNCRQATLDHIAKVKTELSTKQ